MSTPVSFSVLNYNKTESKVYNASVGERMTVLQYDKTTLIEPNSDGIVFDGIFSKTTQSEFNTKMTALFGSDADRPTKTFDYPVMYLSNEKNKSLLPPNKDGSVSFNWINLNSSVYVNTFNINIYTDSLHSQKVGIVSLSIVSNGSIIGQTDLAQFLIENNYLEEGVVYPASGRFINSNIVYTVFGISGFFDQEQGYLSVNIHGTKDGVSSISEKILYLSNYDSNYEITNNSYKYTL